MILVNNPGTWSAVYPPLLHAEWSGWTYTDTIFPFFLFVAGTAMALSFTRRTASGADRGALLRHLAIRAAILVAIGLALNAVGALAFGRPNLRFPGVLQRIGVCALVSGASISSAERAPPPGPRACCSPGYWALLRIGAARSRRRTSRRASTAPCFGAHTWKPGFDPEGLLSTLPAIATMLLGALAGEAPRVAAARGASPSGSSPPAPRRRPPGSSGAGSSRSTRRCGPPPTRS